MHNYNTRVSFHGSFMKFHLVIYKELRLQVVYHFFIQVIWERPRSIWLRYKIGGAQLQYQTNFPLKFHEIPSCGLGGVMDTSCEPPILFWLLSACFALENPKKSIWSKNKIGGVQLHNVTKILWKFHEIPSSCFGGVTDTI